MGGMSFVLDERLERDIFLVGEMPVSRVLLMNDSRWPWLILVPRREALAELTDLDASERALLMEEAASASSFLKAHAKADKINVGALGNVVPLRRRSVTQSLCRATWRRRYKVSALRSSI